MRTKTEHAPVAIRILSLCIYLVHGEKLERVNIVKMWRQMKNFRTSIRMACSKLSISMIFLWIARGEVFYL